MEEFFIIALSITTCIYVIWMFIAGAIIFHDFDNEKIEEAFNKASDVLLYFLVICLFVTMCSFIYFMFSFIFSLF